MNISIFGHGAVGLTIGSLLMQNSRVQCNFFSPLKSRERIQPVYIEHRENTYKIEKDYFFETLTQDKPDLMIVCAKVYNLFKLATTLNNEVPIDSPVIFVSNGLNNSSILLNVNPTRLAFDGQLYMSAQKKGNTVFNYSNKLKMQFDIVHREKLENKMPFTEIFLPNYFEIEFIPQFQKQAWRKLIVTSSINCTCIFFNCSPEQVFFNTEKTYFLASLIKEGIDVARAEGHRFDSDESNKILDEILEMPTKCIPSMYWDYINLRPLEFDYLTGIILQKGIDNNINIDSHRKISKKLKNYAPKVS